MACIYTPVKKQPFFLEKFQMQQEVKDQVTKNGNLKSLVKPYETKNNIYTPEQRT